MSAPIALSWSSGKDGAFALRGLRAAGRDVRALVTSVDDAHGRVSIHGVRRELLRAQADALGLPLREVALPSPCPNEAYEARFLAALEALRKESIEEMAFGDLFLEDVRAYRERLLARAGVRGAYPLWGRDTAQLARDMLAAGVRAVVVCVDTRALDASFAGRAFDAAFLRDLPPGVDPCGENGEFHTFVADGPGFRRPVACKLGERGLREGRFAFCDLLPA